MKLNISLLLVLFCSSVYAQDFTILTKKMAFEAGNIHGVLERCKVSSKSLAIYRDAMQELKEKTFPDSSYQGYIELFDEFYQSGRSQALEKEKYEADVCKKYLNDSQEIVASVDAEL